VCTYCEPKLSEGLPSSVGLKRTGQKDSIIIGISQASVRRSSSREKCCKKSGFWIFYMDQASTNLLKSKLLRIYNSLASQRQTPLWDKSQLNTSNCSGLVARVLRNGNAWSGRKSNCHE